MLNRRGLREWPIGLVLMLGFGVAATGAASLARTSNDATPMAQQDFIRIETRLSQLEQRFYTLESSVRNLEQQARVSSSTMRNPSDDEVRFLRSEVDSLRQRLEDAECNLAKLDERTLSPAMRTTRRRSVGDDPCRLNFDAPLRLPQRP